MSRIDKNVFIQNIEETTTVLQQTRVCIEQIKEIIDRYVEDSELQSEVQRATAKENQIAGNLASEITRAVEAENSINSALTHEISRATSMENQINTKVNNEITRATATENQAFELINNEISRATAKDNQLQTDLTNIENKIGFITLEYGVTTITNEQLAECYKPNCIIKFLKPNSETKYFLKNNETNTASVSNAQFKFYRIGIDNNGTYITIYQDEITINQTSMTYTLYNDSWTVYKKYAVDNELNSKQNNLEFNPTIPTGTTPTTLTNLKDGNNYYSLGGGGGSQLYRHTFQVGVQNSDYIVLFDVISSTSTPVSNNFSSLKSFLDNTFALPSCNCGAYYNNNEKVYPAYLTFDSSTTITMTWVDNNPGNVIAVKSIDITSSNLDSVEDEVTQV